MKEKILGVGTFLALAALAGLLLLHALAIFPGVPAIRWFFASSAVVLGRLDAPAWIQAIFSVVAIFSAIGIAMWQRHSDRIAARRSARVAVMVVGAATDSRLHTLIAVLEAMLDEHRSPCHALAAERAKYFQEFFRRAELPTEAQMLILGEAMPEAAAVMSYGVAAVQRVLVTLDLVSSSPVLTTLSNEALTAQYTATAVNARTAVKHLRDARVEMMTFVNAK